MLLKSKISRIILILGIAISFVVIHFTDLLSNGGLDFDDLARTFIERPFSIPFYIGMLTVPALALSVIIPAVIKWIKSGA